MKTILFNPFKYIAGVRSLIAGLFILLATSCVGFFSHTHFPNLISLFKVEATLPIGYFLLQSLSNWLVFSILLYLLAIVSSSSSIRIIDIFGTQALARLPFLIASFIGFTKLPIGKEINLSSWEITATIAIQILAVLMVIWMIALMFNAFKVSSNLKGTKLVIVFIVAVIAGTIFTQLINHFVLFPYFS